MAVRVRERRRGQTGLDLGVERGDDGGFGGDADGEAEGAGSQDGGEERVDVEGLGFDHEDYGVVAEVGVWAYV